MKRLNMVVVTESTHVCGVKVVFDNNLKMLYERCNVAVIASDNGSDYYYKAISSVVLPSVKLWAYNNAIVSKVDWRRIEQLLVWADVVHLHSLTFLTYRILKLASKLGLRNKIILHLHTQYDQYARSYHLGKPGVWAVRKILHNAMAMSGTIVTPTEHYRRHLEDLLDQSVPGYVWEAPVELPEQTGTFEKILGRSLPKEAQTVCYSGRFVPGKNEQFFLEAMADLVKKRPNTYVIVAGPCDPAKYLLVWERLMGDGAVDHLIFTGSLSRSDLHTLLLGIDVGLNFSNSEAQGLALLEQGLLGKPMVVMQKTCMAEIVQACRGGLVLTPDVKKCGSRIALLLETPWEMRILGHNAKHGIEKRFSWESRAKALLGIYHNVAAGS